MSKIHTIALVPLVEPYRRDGEDLIQTAARLVLDEVLHFTAGDQTRAALIIGTTPVNIHRWRKGINTVGGTRQREGVL